VVGHALLAGALLLCAGVVLHRRASINETLLHGQGRNLPATGVIFALAALGMAGLPPFATYLGTGWVTASAATRGLAWIAVVVAFSSALASAALLRAAGGVFLGLGDPPAEDRQMAEQASEETSETDQAKQRTPLSMIVPAAALVLAAMSVAFVPHLGHGLQHAAVRFADEAGYERTVLSGAAIARPDSTVPYLPESSTSTARDVLAGACTTVCALVLAGLALYARRLPRLRSLLQPGMALVRPLEGFQSGVVNDYVTWIILGVACIGGVLAYAIR
jgi:multicomponent Na+:H+ antiporter subunit D